MIGGRSRTFLCARKLALPLSLSLLAIALSAADAAAQTKSVKIMLDWIIQGTHAPYFVAQEKGYYKAAGVTVDQEFINAELEAKEIKRQTADYSHEHLVLEGETLSSIAAKVYNDPQRWRPIAIANRIDEPRSLARGTRLIVPQLPFRDPETGEVLA